MHTSSAPRGPMGHGSWARRTWTAGQRIDRGTWGRLFKYCRRFLPPLRWRLSARWWARCSRCWAPTCSPISRMPCKTASRQIATSSSRLSRPSRAISRQTPRRWRKQQAAAMAAAGAPVGVGDVDAMSAAGMGAAATGSDTAGRHIRALPWTTSRACPLRRETRCSPTSRWTVSSSPVPTSRSCSTSSPTST